MSRHAASEAKQRDTWWSLRALLLVCFIPTLFVSATAKAQVLLPAEVQGAINEGLDAIKASDWDRAVESLTTAVEKADSNLLYLDSREQYEKFATRFPTHVFRNLALAFDRRGGAALRTAGFYRAYLSYDTQAQDKREIESRIRALEREHLSLVYPLCDAAEARYALAGVVDLDEKELVIGCLIALVLVEDVVSVKRFEARLRAGYFGRPLGDRSCMPAIMIGWGYAIGYAMRGAERDAAEYVGRVAAVPETSPDCAYWKTTLPQLLERYRKNLPVARSASDISPFGPVRTALAWFRWSRPSKYPLGPRYYPCGGRRFSGRNGDFSDPEQPKLPDPTQSISAYLKHAELDAGAAAWKKLSAGERVRHHAMFDIAGHNTCAALMLGELWISYGN